MQLPKLRSLKYLHLGIDQDQLVSETFDMLDQMPFLEYLDLHLFYKELTHKEIERLKNYPHLKKFHFEYRVGEELDISLLSELKSLEEISFVIRKGPPPPVRFTQSLDRVKKLSISDPDNKQNISVEYMTSVARMLPHLEILDLNTIIDHDLLESLKNFKHLKELAAYNLRIDAEEVKRLLPNINVDNLSD